MPNRTRILLVDDHPVVREGLRTFVATRADFQVVADAATADEALALVQAHQPDVILLDLDLNGASGLDLLPAMLQAAPAARALVLTGIRDVKVHQEALARGARGLLLKDQAAAMLLKAIEKVQQGEYWFERAVLGRVLDRVIAPEVPPADSDAGRIASLTAREREIIALVGKGLKNQQIADRLFVSEKTVRNHLTTIFAKLNVGDRFELAIFAYRHGLAQVPA